MLENRNRQNTRNTAYMLMGAGLFLLVGNMIGFFTVAALIVVLLGIYKVRNGEDKTGYILFAVGLLMLLNDHLIMVAALILITLGYFFSRSRQVDKDDSFVRKHNLLESIKHTKDTWVLRNTSFWALIGEIHMDFTLAMMEENEITIIIQSVVGDIDLIVPEEMGVSIDCTSLVGQTIIHKEKEAGLLNKVVWKSPQYDENEYKVKFVVSCIVGDVKLKMM